MLALLVGHYLRSHRGGLACPPIRGCCLQVAWVHRVCRFVWVHQGVQVPLGVGGLLFRDVGGLQHHPYGEERVCRRVRVLESDVRGHWFWLVRPHVVVCQDGPERRHGRRFAASVLGAHPAGLVQLPDAVWVGMALAAALMRREHWVPPRGCWAAGLAPWVSRSWVSLPQVWQPLQAWQPLQVWQLRQVLLE